MLIAWLLLAVTASGVAWRTYIGRRMERAYAERCPPTDTGIVHGAEPIHLAGTNGRAILLLHGSGDSPQALGYLSRQLNASGFTVYAPLLPGHGRSPRAFRRVSADGYLRAARGALVELRRSSGWIAVGGLSMGAAIAAQLAADERDVRVLLLLAPYLIPPRTVERVARSSPLWGLVTPYMAGRGEASVHDPVARAEGRAYGVFSPAALRALVQTAAAGRAALSRVSVPTLVVNSREDNRIPTTLADEALSGLPAPIERHWVTGCGHVITIDYCKDAVVTLVLSFLARHAD